YVTVQYFFYSVHSFCEMVPELLRMEGVKFFLSEKLNQDPIEEHFSKHWAKGGVENPQLEQYMMTERKMIVAKSKMIVAMNVNFRGRTKRKIVIDIDDKTLLPKCPKVPKKSNEQKHS
uniref:Uncharacterized protein n=1 Tax=Clytia hemisphaerica TaxID=252671 RepID=A0A7M5XL33_9CNID